MIENNLKYVCFVLLLMAIAILLEKNIEIRNENEEINLEIEQCNKQKNVLNDLAIEQRSYIIKLQNESGDNK